MKRRRGISGRIAVFVACCAGVAIADTPWIILNEDRDQFACAHLAKCPNEPITRESVRKWAERWFRKPVTHCFVNPNCMTVFWDSRVFDKQFELHRRIGCNMESWQRGHNALMSVLERMYESGIDPHAIFVETARANGISPWLSMRMNDMHYVSSNTCYTSNFWREHPEAWRKPDYEFDKYCRPWLLAFNYANADVRALHLKGLSEMLYRYDVDGVELDWMRHQWHLPPGKEVENAHFLTEFMREARKIVRRASDEKGRDLPLAVRVTTRPDAALGWGTDAFTWAKEGLIDVLIVGNYFDSTDLAIPLAEWKRRLHEVNPSVKLIVGCEPRIAPEPHDRYNWRPISDAEYFGWVERGLANGVDGFYFFNHYALSRDTEFGRRLLDGKPWSYEEFAAHPRSYPVSYCDAAPSQATAGYQTPVRLDVARHIVLPMGIPPKKGRVDVVLCTDLEIEAHVREGIRLNGISPAGNDVAQVKDYMRIGKKTLSKYASKVIFPISAVKRGDNDLIIGGGSKSTLHFCELELVPEECAESL